MSETPTDTTIDESTDAEEFPAIVVEEGPEIVKPQPEGESHDAPPAEPRMSAADRVRARMRGKADGARPGEPSAERRAPRPAKPAPGKPREGSLVKPLTELYTSVGLMLAPIDPVCSTAFLDNAETCAKSLETLARENEAVRRAILALTQTSAWGGVIIAHLPLLLMVMMHHGPKDVRERVAPVAAMMNPAAMARAAEQQRDEEAA